MASGPRPTSGSSSPCSSRLTARPAWAKSARRRAICSLASRPPRPERLAASLRDRLTPTLDPAPTRTDLAPARRMARTSRALALHPRPGAVRMIFQPRARAARNNPRAPMARRSLRADRHQHRDVLAGDDGVRVAAVEAGLTDRAIVGVGPVQVAAVHRHPGREVLGVVDDVRAAAVEVGLPDRTSLLGPVQQAAAHRRPQ